MQLTHELVDGPAGSTDKVLAEHWRDWAKAMLLNHPAYHPRELYGFWRFEKGFLRRQARTRAHAGRALYERKRLLKQIDEFDICDWHSFWGDETLEERRQLILKAGRPDLIDPETCARFGVA